MKKYILFVCGLLITACISAQTKKINFGVSADVLATVTNASPLQLGSGNYLGAWASYKVDHFTSIRITLGHRHSGGYQRQKVTVTERFYPNEYQQQMTTSVLENFNHVQLQAEWDRRLKTNSRWSYSLGGYAAVLTAVDGGTFSIDWVARTTGISYVDGSNSPSFLVRTTNSSNQDLLLAEMTRYDFGLSAGIRYELLPGLSLRAQLSQGLQDLLAGSRFSSTQQHYLTAFSLGFSAKIK